MLLRKLPVGYRYDDQFLILSTEFTPGLNATEFIDHRIGYLQIASRDLCSLTETRSSLILFDFTNQEVTSLVRNSSSESSV